MNRGEQRMSSVGRILATTPVFAITALSGCMSDTGPVPPRRMPTASAVAATAPLPTSTDDALAQARAAVARNDFSATVQALEKPASTERVYVVRKLMRELASSDFSKAERVCTALPAGSMQLEATGILARTRVDRDPAAAVHWALAYVSPSLASRARQAVAEQLIAQQPKATMLRLLALPDSPARNELLGYAAASWARSDAVGAVGWVRALDNGTAKDHMGTSMGFALAQSQPARAVELLDILPQGRDRMAVIGAIGQTWVARDENETWRWANQLPAGAAREAAVAGIETGLGGAGSHLVQNDTRFTGRTGNAGLGTTRGGGSLPLGEQRDDALRREFEEALRESPLRAASLLTALPAPDRRDEMVDELVRRWLPINPEAAKTWVDQNIPNPARREMLLREAVQFRD
jgi:hypothetical protein